MAIIQAPRRPGGHSRSRSALETSILHWLCCGVAAAALACPAKTSAQQAAPPAASGEVGTPLNKADQGIPDIVVTAQRREERLSTVPISLTTFSGDQLKARQIDSVQSLASIAPTLTVTSSVGNGAGDVLLGMRGLALFTIIPNVDSTIGMYVDGTYYARTVGSNIGLIDMDRVEVLRGPQGTLFGRNTIGGALNITTRKPTDQLEGVVSASYGNYDDIRASAIVNLPLSEGVATRIVYEHQQHDGYGRNTNLGVDLSDKDTDYFRGSLRIKPLPNVTFDLVGDYVKSRSHSSNFVLSYFDPDPAARSPTLPADLGSYLRSEGRDNQAGIDPLTRLDIFDINGTLSVDLGPLSVKSITAYRDLDVSSGVDLDGTPYRLGDLAISNTKGHQISQELQVTGKAFNNKLDWIIGAYYFRERIADIRFFNSDALGGVSTEQSLPRVVNQSKSIFAQASYEFTPRFRFTVGARYVSDKREITYRQPRRSLATGQILAGAAGCGFALALSNGGEPCVNVADPIKFNYVPWTVGVDFRPDDRSMIYAKVSRGFRSGGFQQAVIVNPDTGTPFGAFDAEKVTSYELGSKLALFNNHLRLSVAGYVAQYGSIQQSIPFYPAGGSTVVVLRILNAGRARIAGGEFEATALLGSLELTSGLGVVDAKFTSGPYEGSAFIASPKVTFSVGGRLPIDTGAGKLTLSADYHYQSDQLYFTDYNVATNPPTVFSDRQIASVTQKGYGIGNAQVRLEPKGTNLGIGLWTKNMFNKYYDLRKMSFYGQGFNTSLPGEPRTYGVSVSYKF